jgi:hypothetical protein
MKKHKKLKGASNHRRPRARPKSPVMDVLIRQTTPTFESFFIEEPRLVFANAGLSVDPKEGLERFGPYEADKGANRVIRVGIIGSGIGIQTFAAYLEKCRGRVPAGFSGKGKPYDVLCFPDFPGCADDRSFRCSFVTETGIQRIVPDEYFEHAVKPAQESARLQEVVELLTKEVAALADLESAPDVVVFVMPKMVEDECATVGAAFRGVKVKLTQGQKFERKLHKDLVNKGQSFLRMDFDLVDEGERHGFWNIHHALKAHCMKYGLPSQLIWQSTLTGEGGTQDQASIAWNILTALYYKAGNRPWHLQTLAENTCYVGVAFYRESPYANADMQSSLAQVFGAGEGLVLKGQRAVVDKKLDSKAHLDSQGAEQLLRQAIELYTAQHKQPPKRVVLHKTSRFWRDELLGFQKGLGDIAFHDFLTLETLDTRFMRVGKEPPLRGSVIMLGTRNYLLYTVGYVPYFRLYPGFRIPRPLEIVEHFGHSPAHDVCREILALTKLNWNSCAFGSSLPITLRFARDVGKILAELPVGVTPQTKYKFYM